MDADPSPIPATAPEVGTTWVSLLRALDIGGVAVIVVAILIFGFFPPIAVFPVLWGVGAFLLSRGTTKAGAIVSLIAFVAFLFLNGPFVIPSLTVPASWLEFFVSLAILVVCVFGIIASIAVLRRLDPAGSSTPRRLGIVAAAITVLGLVVGLMAYATYDSATAQQGDIKLVAEDVKFSDESLESESGKVAVFVENNDKFLHTFTIDELDVDLELPGGTSGRIEFVAPAGTYDFICVPHEADMKGKLEVK